MGQLWDVPAERIAFTPSAAEGMAWLARGLDWRPGDNVVTTNLEFPSVAYNWRNVRQQGVELRLVPHCDWLLVREEDLLAAVDERTRVLAVSQVSFYTGQNLDVEQLADGLAGRDALLAVDATHAAGAVAVPAACTDLCVSSCYKWLLGDPRSCAVLFEPAGRGASALYGFWLAQLGGVASARGCARTRC